MLVGICGEYFNADDIRHMYTQPGQTTKYIVVVELMNGDFHYLPYIREKEGEPVEEYLERIVEGINMISGRVR